MARPIDETFEIAVEGLAGDLDRLIPVPVTEHVKRQHHPPLPRVTGLDPGIPVNPYQLPHAATRQGNRHHRIAVAARPFKRLRCGQSGDPKRRPRHLRGPRQRGDVFERVKPACTRDVFTFEQQTHLLHPLIKPGSALVHTDAEMGELTRQKRPREPHFKAPPGDRIQHADLARQLERVIKHRQHRSGDQTGLAGAHGSGGEKHDWIRRIPAVGVKVMFHRAHIGISQLVA